MPALSKVEWVNRPYLLLGAVSFGAREATIFSKRGSSRDIGQIAIVGLRPTWGSVRASINLCVQSHSIAHALVDPANFFYSKDPRARYRTSSVTAVLGVGA